MFVNPTQEELEKTPKEAFGLDAAINNTKIEGERLITDQEGDLHEYKPTGIVKNTVKWRNRFMVGTATTGLVRIEWVQARYNQLIPTNWSLAEIMQWLNPLVPADYIVSDAQNLIVKSAIEQDAEWLFLLEQDNIIAPMTFFRLNEYMQKGEIPVVSGLYFTKSNPPEPMIYRGEGNSFYADWKMGDKVWASGVPTGCLLIHMSILREMWNDSPEYIIGNQVTRKVFAEPSHIWFNPEKGRMESQTGTSDLAWCKRVMEGKYFEKAGWPKLQEKEFPFLVDTNMYTPHIDQSGVQWPIEIPRSYMPDPKKKNENEIIFSTKK